jgi:DNA-binding CsgD family transcriptional regulator
MIFIGEKTKQEINDYLKTRVDSMDFSKDLIQILVDSNIRTIGGIISKNGSEIFTIKGVDKNFIHQIADELSSAFVVKLEGENINFVPKYYEKKLLNVNDSNLNNQDKLDILNELEGEKSLKRIQKEIREKIAEKQSILNLEILSLGLSIETERLLFRKNILKLGNILSKRNNLNESLLLKISEVLSYFETKIEDVDNEIKKLYREEFEITNTYRDIGDSDIVQEDKGISERDIGILSSFFDGDSYKEICKHNNISRERVRQIINKVLDKIGLDYYTEREKIKLKREFLKPKKIIKIKKWGAKKYDSCIECLTTEFPHFKSGKCQRCAGAFRGKTREAIVLAHDNMCDMCGSSRDDSLKIYGRDFYVTKEQDVLCRKCFLETTGKKLGNWKNYEWSRFYSKCKSCDSTKNPHLSRGVCIDCSEFITDEKREAIISGANNECHSCKMPRPESYNIHGRDLYITKEEDVLCRKCHLEKTLDSARETHKNKWKMFYKD